MSASSKESHHQYLLRKFKEDVEVFFECTDRIKVSKTVYPVDVPTDKSVEDLVAWGKYDEVSAINGHIDSENFPDIGPKGHHELVLVYFDFPISFKDKGTEIRKLGLERAHIGQLLVFGATYPSIQLKFPVSAEGSIYKNNLVASLSGRNKREIYLIGGIHLAEPGFGIELAYRTKV